MTTANREAPKPSEPSPRSEPTTALPFVDDYLAALLAQASLMISSAFHQVVTRHGLSVAEWRVLATLAGGRAVSIGQLAQIAVSKQSTVTRILDRMEKKGHVARLAHSSDRRITLVRITPAGNSTVSHLIALARQHEERVLAPIGAAAASDLKAMLRRLIDANSPPLRGAAVPASALALDTASAPDTDAASAGTADPLPEARHSGEIPDPARHPGESRDPSIPGSRRSPG